MISRFDETRQGLSCVVRAAFAAAAAKGLLPDAEPAPYVVEIPADPKNGDFSTNAAMVNARAMRSAPQKIAAVLTDHFDFGELPVERCEIAGPGFINFYMKQEWFGSLAAEALEKGAHYGRSDYGNNEKVMVEFVSANPTGPMHMGNARGGAIGDCLAAALEWSGHDVTREFYVNDAGNQINKFGASLSVRYLQLFEGEEKHPLPEDCYQGMDILDHAREFAKLYGDKYVNAPEEERRQALVDYALPLNIAALERDLGRYRIHYDVWFRESVLHQAGKVAAICEKRRENGWAYEKEGALWFETTRFGDDKDRVLRKTDGSYTYLVPDIAYHKDKMDRGYDLLVDFFGADHHGYVPRLKASIAALGNDPERLAVDIIQMVRLVENGQEVKMSKRLGNAVTIRELCDEVGVDAARYFFVQRALDTHLDFDLGLARSQSNDNPVYYAQYAHARMCSILRQAQDVPEASSYERLTHEKEADLMKYINEFTSVVSEAARLRAPHKVCNYIQKLAQKFHSFYNACKVIDREDMELSAQRLDLVKAARITLGNALELIGVEAPEKM